MRSSEGDYALRAGADEAFHPDRFAPLLVPARPDLQVTIVPGIGHIGMIISPAGIAAVRAAFERLAAPAAVLAGPRSASGQAAVTNP